MDQVGKKCVVTNCIQNKKVPRSGKVILLSPSSKVEAQWLEILNLVLYKNKIPLKTSPSVCSLHFVKSDFCSNFDENLVLKETAVPSVNLDLGLTGNGVATVEIISKGDVWLVGTSNNCELRNIIANSQDSAITPELLFVFQRSFLCKENYEAYICKDIPTYLDDEVLENLLNMAKQKQLSAAKNFTTAVMSDVNRKNQRLGNLYLFVEEEKNRKYAKIKTRSFGRCRLCLNCFKKSNLYLISSPLGGNTNVTIKDCLSSLFASVSDNFQPYHAVCVTCLHHLQITLNFFKFVFDVEGILSTLLKDQSVIFHDLENMDTIQQSLISSEIKCEPRSPEENSSDCSSAINKIDYICSSSKESSTILDEIDQNLFSNEIKLEPRSPAESTSVCSISKNNNICSSSKETSTIVNEVLNTVKTNQKKLFSNKNLQLFADDFLDSEFKLDFDRDQTDVKYQMPSDLDQHQETVLNKVITKFGDISENAKELSGELGPKTDKNITDIKQNNMRSYKAYKKINISGGESKLVNLGSKEKEKGFVDGKVNETNNIMTNVEMLVDDYVSDKDPCQSTTNGDIIKTQNKSLDNSTHRDSSIASVILGELNDDEKFSITPQYLISTPGICNPEDLMADLGRDLRVVSCDCNVAKEKRILFVGTLYCNICQKPKKKCHCSSSRRAGLCQVCGQIKYNIYPHVDRCKKMQKNNDPGELKCNRCNTIFTKLYLYKNHLKKIADAPVCNYFQCKVCLKKFAWDDFKEHAKNHPNYLCPKCGKSFIANNDLSHHRRKCNLPELKEKCKTKTLCPICGVLLTEEKYLTRHLKLHGEKTETCEICGKKYTFKSYLKKHIALCHNGGTFACHICDKQFANVQYLKIHINVVHIRKPVATCKICNTTFARKDYYHLHMKTHHNNQEKLTVGERRERRIKFKTLTRGLSICSICKKTLPWSQLYNHYTNHFPQRFKCQFCQITICGNKTRHERLHKDSRFKFRCIICFKRNNSEDELKKHMQKSHSKKPKNTYQCYHCNECYPRKYLLRDHMETTHNLQIPDETIKTKVRELMYQTRINMEEQEH